MSVIHVEFQQASTPAPDRIGLNGEELRQEIRQSVQDAAQQVRDAALQARDAARRVRDARQEVRDVEQRLREARTADQRTSANQALHEAKGRLADAQAALEAHSSTIVHVGGTPMVADVPTAPTSVYVGRGPVDSIPPQVVDMAMGFFVMCAVIIIGWPLARAFGRRIERRGETAAIDPVVASQLQRIEQAVEAMSIEVERISESQRFMVRLQNGAPGSAVPVERR